MINPLATSNTDAASFSNDAIYRQTLRHFWAPVADALFNDEDISEVLVNGPDQIFVERRGVLEPYPARFESAEALQAAVNNLAEFVGRRLDDDHHSMDARLPPPERFRVHAIIPPCARGGITVSIRKFKRAELSLAKLVEGDSMTDPVREYLEAAVLMHRNLVISGGTGTGKTSLLNALSEAIPEQERIVVIEDSSELQLAQPHTVYLEARPGKADGRRGVTIRDLFVDSLRMRPDRIVVGEVRRGEALDLIQSMLSGHDGALSTVHASSPTLALTRLETLCMMSDVQMPVYVARTQVASAIQTIVQIARAASGKRHVSRVSEVVGLDDRDRYELIDLFVRPPGKTAKLEPTGHVSRFAEQIRAEGIATQFPAAAVVWGDSD